LGQDQSQAQAAGEEDKRIRFWVVSSDPNYEYGNPDAQIRAFAAGPTGKRDLRLAGHDDPFKVLVSQFPPRSSARRCAS
jgi:two-component system heavy metal sensor histidine kinase CusS